MHAALKENADKIRKAGFNMRHAFEQLGQAFESPTLSAVELRSVLHKDFEIPPEMLMDKHERQHANHPTEKNPNHPRFQRQPNKPRRKK